LAKLVDRAYDATLLSTLELVDTAGREVLDGLQEAEWVDSEVEEGQESAVMKGTVLCPLLRFRCAVCIQRVHNLISHRNYR
jgi:hypothetical protein